MKKLPVFTSSQTGITGELASWRCLSGTGSNPVSPTNLSKVWQRGTPQMVKQDSQISYEGQKVVSKASNCISPESKMRVIA